MTSTAANFHFDSADFVVAAHPLQGFVVFDSHDQDHHEMVNSNLTPKQARKLAKALKRAADAVDKPAAPIFSPGQELKTYHEVWQASQAGFEVELQMNDGWRHANGAFLTYEGDHHPLIIARRIKPEPKYKVGQVLETYEEVRDAHALGFPLHRGCGIYSGPGAPRHWAAVSSYDTPASLGATYTIAGEA